MNPITVFLTVAASPWARDWAQQAFNLTNILDCAAGASTRYSSRPPFRETPISAALVEFLECHVLGVRCGVLRFDEIRLLKLFMYLDLLHPWVG
ncbi:MAG: hypothetical protein WA869_08450 [Alloacidobacterium sp.]